jgi:hypothetical protein
MINKTINIKSENLKLQKFKKKRKKEKKSGNNPRKNQEDRNLKTPKNQY